MKWFGATRFRRWTFGYIPSLLIAFIIFCNVLISQNAKGRVFTSIDQVPNCSAAVVFGTSPKKKGLINLFYLYRMEAAAALWKSGKVKYIIVSGDNSTAYYDEATYMKTTLKKLGVPDSVIALDYAGLRTLDSVVRASWVFGQNNIVVVSQEFQNERALYIADHFGINAVALNAKDVPGNYGWKTAIREYLARVKAVLDVTIFQTKPTFSGPRERLGK